MIVATGFLNNYNKEFSNGHGKLKLKSTPIKVILGKTSIEYFHLFLTKCFIVPQQNSSLYYR